MRKKSIKSRGFRVFYIKIILNFRKVKTDAKISFLG